MDDYAKDVASLIKEMLQSGEAQKGEMLVIGCNTSRICGGFLGRKGIIETASDIAQAALDTVSEAGLYLAVQCSESMDRALAVERKAAQRYGLAILPVIPGPRMAGTFANAVCKLMKEPVIVKNIRAQWGLDIGQTMIGMHLEPVAVTISTSIHRIGAAPVVAAHFRPISSAL